jgi:hypothetical protein
MVSKNVDFGTLYADNEMASYRAAQIADAVMSDINVNHIADLIISRQDPLRAQTSKGERILISDKVKSRLAAWQALGKFEQRSISIDSKITRVLSVSPITLRDAYNLEFVNEFSDTILPTSDITSVKSVTDPNGMYAQQTRVIVMNSKPVPLYRQSAFKRLNDWNLDARIDESTNLFYKMDSNPRLSADERKKTEVDQVDRSSYLDREGLQYRMIPKY